ncbi:hypothetical protein ACS0TY_030279 [Phlomoides rotata]
MDSGVQAELSAGKLEADFCYIDVLEIQTPSSHIATGSSAGRKASMRIILVTHGFSQNDVETKKMAPNDEPVVSDSFTVSDLDGALLWFCPFGGDQFRGITGLELLYNPISRRHHHGKRSIFFLFLGKRPLLKPVSVVGSGLEASITNLEENVIGIKNFEIVVKSKDDDKMQQPDKQEDSKTTKSMIQTKLTFLYGHGSKENNQSSMADKISEDCAIFDKKYSGYKYPQNLSMSIINKAVEEEGARGPSFKKKRLHRENISPRIENLKSPSGSEEVDVDASRNEIVTARAKLHCLVHPTQEMEARQKRGLNGSPSASMSPQRDAGINRGYGARSYGFSQRGDRGFHGIEVLRNGIRNRASKPLYNIVMFIITMYVNNCPKNSLSCVAGFLGRFSFQPFKENPLLGPSSALDKMGALNVAKVVDDHEGWRLITCMWLHGAVFHLLANMLSLVVIGIRLEQEFGFVRIGLLYLILGFGGSLLTSLFIQSNISDGASGALFGLLGGMLSELITNWTIYANKVHSFDNFKQAFSKCYTLLAWGFSLTWTSYLHKYSRLKIIHRDLKPNNILLDENMNPKISDFGSTSSAGREFL